jgi:hypothetical protein
MKTEPLEQNIYFVIQPLYLVSRILGLSPFHIDSNYRFHNEGGSAYCHITQATLLILLIIYGLYNSTLAVLQYREPIFNVSVRVVWAINALVSNLTSILALLFAVTINRNHITNVLSLLSRVDRKFIRKNSKQSAYSQQRSHVIKQLWVTFILFVVVYAQSAYYYSDGTGVCYINMSSQLLRTVINTFIVFQYVNIVLMVKQRYQLMKHILSEAVSTDDVNYSRHVAAEHLTSRNITKIFPMTAYNLESDSDSRDLYTVRDLRLICSELCDALHANNKSYEVLILFDVITILTITVPTTYYGVMTIESAILENGHLQLYLKGITLLSECAFMLLILLWLAICCQKTTEEIHGTFVCIQKLLLYPNALGWSTSELKSFSSQLKNSKVEFNVCGFFTLNLKFFSASVSVMFTYILVLNQFS